MKKVYQKPETIVAELSMMSQLLTGTDPNKVTKIGGNVFNSNGVTGSTTDARTKEYNAWDEWEE